MSQQKRGLGKGLGALIPTAPEGLSSRLVADVSVPQQGAQSSDYPRDAAGAYFDEVPVTSISPNPRQPPQIFAEEALAELAASIKVVGLLHPALVLATSPDH